MVGLANGWTLDPSWDKSILWIWKIHSTMPHLYPRQQKKPHGENKTGIWFPLVMYDIISKYTYLSATRWLTYYISRPTIKIIMLLLINKTFWFNAEMQICTICKNLVGVQGERQWTGKYHNLTDSLIRWRTSTSTFQIWSEISEPDCEDRCFPTDACCKHHRLHTWLLKWIKDTGWIKIRMLLSDEPGRCRVWAGPEASASAQQPALLSNLGRHQRKCKSIC